MRWRSVIKFVLGFGLAAAILISGGVATALYFLYRVTTPPPKPIFANDTAAVKAQGSANIAANTSPNPQANSTVNSAESSSATPLAAGTYRARVTWAEGLSVRSEPDVDAQRLAGAAYNEELIVLEESADKNWQKVRLDSSEQEGWIKSGNIERIEE